VLGACPETSGVVFLDIRPAIWIVAIAVEHIEVPEVYNLWTRGGGCMGVYGYISCTVWAALMFSADGLSMLWGPPPDWLSQFAARGGFREVAAALVFAVAILAVRGIIRIGFRQLRDASEERNPCLRTDLLVSFLPVGNGVGPLGWARPARVKAAIPALAMAFGSEPCEPIPTPGQVHEVPGGPQGGARSPGGTRHPIQPAPQAGPDLPNATPASSDCKPAGKTSETARAPAAGAPHGGGGRMPPEGGDRQAGESSVPRGPAPSPEQLIQIRTWRRCRMFTAARAFSLGAATLVMELERVIEELCTEGRPDGRSKRTFREMLKLPMNSLPLWMKLPGMEEIAAAYPEVRTLLNDAIGLRAGMKEELLDPLSSAKGLEELRSDLAQAATRIQEDARDLFRRATEVENSNRPSDFNPADGTASGA
jgi:hypothetical protein